MSVFTSLSDHDIHELLAVYDIGSFVKAEPLIEGIDNTNYKITTRKRLAVLTVFEGRIPRNRILKILKYVSFLKSQGIPCPEIFKTRDGQWLTAFEKKPAALQEFLEGEDLKNPTPGHCKAAGHLLAQAHLAGKEYSLGIANDLLHDRWRQLITESLCNEKDLKKRLLMEEEELHSRWPKNLPSGPIHGDFFPNNLKVSGNTLTGVFDFYFACEDFWAYDLAVAFNAWAFEQEKFVAEKAAALLEGYESLRPLELTEKAVFSLLCRGAALRIIATRLHDWDHAPKGETITTLDPLEYAARLEFHRQTNVIRDLGL